jgi:phage FluMu protein Com
MAIEFPCSGCAEVFVVAEVTAGRKGKCPKCAVVNRVPRPQPKLSLAAQMVKVNGTAAAAPTPAADVAPPGPAAGEEKEPAAVTWVPPAKRKPRRRVPWLFIGGLVVALICLGIGGYYLYTQVFLAEPAGNRAGSR